MTYSAQLVLQKRGGSHVVYVIKMIHRINVGMALRAVESEVDVQLVRESHFLRARREIGRVALQAVLRSGPLKVRSGRMTVRAAIQWGPMLRFLVPYLGMTDRTL